MKPYPRKSLTHQQTSNYQGLIEMIIPLQKPNPPTEAAIKRAQFVDKTYVWKSK